MPPPDTAPLPADVLLDRLYLELRAKLLEMGSALDRIERAESSNQILGDSRLQQISAGLQILNSSGCDRAERIQMLFSDPYVPNWNLKVPPKG